MTSIDPELLMAQTDWLRQLALQLVGDAELADDAVQDACVAALETPPERGHNERGLRAWLAQVVRNAVRMRWRQDRRRRNRENEAAARLLCEREVAHADEPIEAQQRLLAAVMSLPARDRQIIVQRFFEGLPPRKIAQQTGRTSAAVRNHLSRAIAALRTRVADGGRQPLALALVPLLPSATPKRLAWYGFWIVSTNKLLVVAAVAASLTLACLALWSLSADEDRRLPPSATASAAVTSSEAGQQAERQPAAAAPEASARTLAITGAPASEPNAVASAKPVITATGRIVDEDGNPLPGAKLVAIDVVGKPAVEADADGRVRFEIEWPQPLAAGNESWLELVASSPARVVVRLRERIERGRSIELALGVIRLGPAGDLHGSVFGVDGQPAKDAYVWASAGVSRASGPTEDLRRVMGRGFGGLGAGLRAWARTDERGRYRIEGVPVGSLTVVARLHGYLADYTDAFGLAAGAEVRVADLHLGAVPDKNRIAGFVRADDGSPVAGAKIEVYEGTARNVNPFAYAATGADGAFSAVVLSGREYTLSVDVGGDDSRTMHRGGIRAGARDVLLQFGKRSSFTLVTRGEGGEVVEPSHVYGYDESGHYLELSRVARDDGVWELVAPECAFSLTVMAEGYQAEGSGPLDPVAMPKRLALTMQRAAVITGRVLSSEGPVAGAEVHTHFVNPREPVHYFATGLYTKLRGRRGRSVTTGDDGTFELQIARRGDYVLHAKVDGWARGTSDVLTLGPGAAAPAIELWLVSPGGIAGRLLVGKGESVEGHVVGATSGDGHVEVDVTDAEGSYRFEGLAPGSWHLRVCRVDEAEWMRQNHTWPEYAPRKLPADVEVRSGLIAEYNLDRRNQTSARIAGRVRIAGMKGSDWRVSLSRDGDYVRTEVAADGTFAVAGKPGAATIYWFSSLPRGGRLRAWRTLALVKGVNSVELEHPVGGLELLSLPPASASPLESIGGSYALVWQRGDDSFVYRFDADADGNHRFDGLPIGRAELRRRNERDDIARWDVVRTVEIADGELRTVQVR